MSDRSSRMPIAIEMRDAINALAGERAWNETRERWLERAARRGNVSYRQAKSLFYGEGNPRAETVERVRAAVRNRRKENLREAINAYSALKDAIERARSARLVCDEEFFGPEIDAWGEMLGGTNRTVAEGD